MSGRVDGAGGCGPCHDRTAVESASGVMTTRTTPTGFMAKTLTARAEGQRMPPGTAANRKRASR